MHVLARIRIVLACLTAASLTLVSTFTPGAGGQSGAFGDSAIDRFAVSPSAEPQLSVDQQVRLLRQKMKFVFVIYQENRSFDSYFGTFPGADGLYARPANQMPGFYQPILGTDGQVSLIHPFRIGPEQSAADTDDVDHSHTRIVAKMDVSDTMPLMDRFALIEEQKYTSPGSKPTLRAKQMGELTMAYEDCDTVPILWRYANRFVLFDRIFQQFAGPSTPGNLSIIAAQNGATQWVRHPDQAYSGNGERGPGVPVVNDADPLWGSQLDPTPRDQRTPVNPHDFSGTPPRESDTQRNLTFASLPLTLAGRALGQVAARDRDPSGDLGDVREDVAKITESGADVVPWGWYQEGYTREPTDAPAGSKGVGELHTSYITHHNGPQYFGYVSNNPVMRRSLHGLHDLLDAIDHRRLPAKGGVFYIKGGTKNMLGLLPSDPDPRIQQAFLGDDDHPAYADAQISEAMAADAINRIARSPYWAQSAIVMTWDDSEGDYDHVPPQVLSRTPDGVIQSDGPRVPLLVISPYARVHAISHEQGDTASVVKFIDQVFNLTPLAMLPDELAAREEGQRRYGQLYLGPYDALTPGVGDLLSAFDPARLAGQAPPLPPDYVLIPNGFVNRLPAASLMSCASIGVVPTDRQMGIRNEIPPDFNPRPSTTPSP